MALLTQNIFQLVYISQASDSLSYQDIENILKSSKAQNTINQITGVLIYRDGFFIQFLEGESEEAVKKTLSRIIQDQRHNTVRVISEWLGPKRLFAQWQMGFCDSDVQERNSYFEFIEKLFSDSMLVTLPKQNELIQFFNDFSKSGIDLK